MVKLSQITPDRKTIAEGQWRDITIMGLTFKVKLRGVTPHYSDRLQALQRAAVIEFNSKQAAGLPVGTWADVPVSVHNKVFGMVVAEEAVLDIADLEDDSGAPMTVEAFRDVLRTGEEPQVCGLILHEINQVGRRLLEAKEAVKKDTVKNSKPRSNGASNGAVSSHTPKARRSASRRKTAA